MQLQQMNGAVAATWILVAGLIGFGSNVTSVGGAAWVLGLGLVPPFLVMLHWSRALPMPIRPAPVTAGSRTIHAPSAALPGRGLAPPGDLSA